MLLQNGHFSCPLTFLRAVRFEEESQTLQSSMELAGKLKEEEAEEEGEGEDAAEEEEGAGSSYGLTETIPKTKQKRKINNKILFSTNKLSPEK
jgi:hypothetical protein